MRATNGATTRQRRKAMKRRVEGSWGTRHTSFKIAHQTYVQAQEYAYIGRKQKKRDFRKLWIQRINVACRPLGITYSKFMAGLSRLEIEINRKMLSELAIQQPEQFAKLVEQVKKLPKPTAKHVKKEQKALAEKQAAKKAPKAKKPAAKAEAKK